MNIRKGTLWRVPVFCVIAGFIAFYLCIYALMYLAITTSPSGTVRINPARELAIYGIMFLGVLFLGGLVFFCSMSRREIFCSASIMVIYGILLLLTQWAFSLTAGAAPLWLLSLFRPFGWCTIIPQLISKLCNLPWLGAFMQVFSLYLFIPFGKHSDTEVPSPQ